MKLRTIAVLALLCAGGCKKNVGMDASYPGAQERSVGAPSDGSYGDYGGGDDMDMDMGVMADVEQSAPEPMDEPAMEAPTDDSGTRRRVFRARRDRRSREAKTEMASPPPPAEPTSGDKSGAAVAEPGKPEKAIEEQDPEIAARHIVYTAAMTVSVFNLEDAMTKAEALPESYGGYISQMSEGHLVLRIPSRHLRGAMEELGKFGNVENRTLQAMDVTAQFTDIESRIKALEETHKQLLELLSKARTVQEALQVRQTLDNISTELEVLKGQMRQMQNQISFSTLTIGLYERGPHTPIPSSNDPFPWVNDLGVEATEWK